MKKIVGILGMAAVMASAAFAADPATNFALTKFDGSAEFGFKADFADSDNVKYGMYNTITNAIEFGFVTAGDKVTTGDGIWGEIKISSKESKATALPAAPSIDVAKIHFVDGDFNAALNIKAPELKYAGVTPFTAAPIADPTGVSLKADAQKAKDAADKAVTDAKDAENKAKEAFDKATAADYLDLMFKYNAAKTNTAEKEKAAKEAADLLAKIKAPALATPGLDANLGLTNGFALELGLKDIFGLNVRFMDNGLAKDKKFGMGIDASLLAVKNLDAKVALAMNFDTNYTGLQAIAGYKFNIDDKLYIKPGVTYEMVKANKDAKVSNALAAGLMFGWGAVDQEPGLDFISNKTNEGVSVAVCPSLNDDKNSTIGLSIALYDQSLFSLLGLEDFGTLKTGFTYNTLIGNVTNGDKKVTSTTSAIAAALKYEVKVNIINFAIHGGVNVSNLITSSLEGFKAPDSVTDYAFGVKLSTSEIIDNTDLYVSYELASTAKAKKATKSELVIGSKIHF